MKSVKKKKGSKIELYLKEDLSTLKKLSKMIIKKDIKLLKELSKY